MNFSSIKEYFYKMYNACYLLLLIPLIIFIFIYYQLQGQKIIPLITSEFDTKVLLTCTIALSLINLTIVHLISMKRLRGFAKLTGLGVKLDGYYEVMVMRFAAGAICSLLMAIGLLLSGTGVFAYSFLAVMIVQGVQWPTSARACKALKLKGAEYKMVYYKTEK